MRTSSEGIKLPAKQGLKRAGRHDSSHRARAQDELIARGIPGEKPKLSRCNYCLNDL